VKKVVLLALLAVACSRSETSTTSSLDRELDRLDASLRTLKPSSLAKTHAESIAKARAAQSADLKLYRMRDAWVGVETLAFLARHADANTDIAKVEALWKERGPAIAKKPAAHGPPMQRALIEAAANRAEKFYRASLPYGRSAGPGDGLYYLAEADANARFGEWVASLPGDDQPRTYALDERMAALERDMLQAFASDPSGKTTIPVSTRLKESRELHAQKLEDGAALLLAEARTRLDRKTDDGIPALLASMHGAPAVAVKKPTSVKVTLVRWPYT
jgi:hypothetical protein